jgi:hypothetical protein
VDELQEQESKRETMLTITNNHYKCCGVPPKLEDASAYFVNAHGEQIILQHNPEAKTCRMWHGDVGWEEPLKVVEFRGHALVLFVGSRDEREREFKMNTQFDHRDFLQPKDEAEAQRQKADHANFKKMVNAQLRKDFGKPKLTDEECEFVSDGPRLSQDERQVIAALWKLWNV